MVTDLKFPSLHLEHLVLDAPSHSEHLSSQFEHIPVGFFHFPVGQVVSQVDPSRKFPLAHLLHVLAAPVHNKHLPLQAEHVVTDK